MISVKIDAAELTRKITRMGNYAGNPAMRAGAAIVIRDIKANSRAGVDANKGPFPHWTPTGERTGPGPYSPEHASKRKRRGKQTGKKDMRVDGSMLNGLELRGRMVTVSPQDQLKALGQMFHPGWRYHHEFLLASDNAVGMVERKLATDIEQV